MTALGPLCNPFWDTSAWGWTSLTGWRVGPRSAFAGMMGMETQIFLWCLDAVE